MSDCTQNDRFKEQSPFTNVGLDLFGSYEVTDGQTTRRNSESKTVLGVVFISLVTWAIHIEVAPGLDTSSFVNAMIQFFVFKVVSNKIRRDNVSNLMSAIKQLQSTFALDKLQKEAKLHGCE